MTSCSTWHVRIDLIGEGDDVVARVKLVGAPPVAHCPAHAVPDPHCVTCRDPRSYTSWQQLPDTVQDLVELLTGVHRTGSGPADLVVAHVPASRGPSVAS